MIAHRRLYAILLAVLGTLLLTGSVSAQAAGIGSARERQHPGPGKQFDLVLVHGIAGQHWWSDSFMGALADQWGHGRVYVVILNNSDHIEETLVQGKLITFIGDSSALAGTDDIDTLAQQLAHKIDVLQASHGLDEHFDIIGHSIGALVCRQFAYMRPNTVVDMVTIAGPHHGSPLADIFEWTGFFIGAADALADLKPSYIEGTFNPTYPVSGMPLYASGKMSTIHGDSDGGDWGVIGELFFGWHNLNLLFGLDSDGVVPHSSAQIAGAEHIGTFWSYDHWDLVKQPSVAQTAALALR